MFKVTLTDADGVIIDTWKLETPTQNCECPWLENDGKMTIPTGRELGEQIAHEIAKLIDHPARRAAKRADPTDTGRNAA